MMDVRRRLCSDPRTLTEASSEMLLPLAVMGGEPEPADEAPADGCVMLSLEPLLLPRSLFTHASYEISRVEFSKHGSSLSPSTISGTMLVIVTMMM